MKNDGVSQALACVTDHINIVCDAVISFLNRLYPQFNLKHKVCCRAVVRCFVPIFRILFFDKRFFTQGIVLLTRLPTLSSMASITTQQISEEEAVRLRPVLDIETIRTIPGNVTLPATYHKYKERYKNWQVRPDDVYLIAFPKTGTTWTQELAWLVQNNCNFDEARFIPLDTRFPFIDYPFMADVFKDELPGLAEGNFFQMMQDMPSPRMLKSHLHFCLLPDDLCERSEVIICLRNPKDTVVSYYHFEKNVKKYHAFKGDFPTYFDLFMDNLVTFGYYFDAVKEAWARRNHPNVCLLFFEDMKKDLATNVRKVAKFLGKELTNENVEALVDHLSFKKMRNNATVNREDMKKVKIFSEDGDFMRKGEIGDWKNYFTDEMNKRMDEAIEKHFTPIGLEFQYD